MTTLERLEDWRKSGAIREEQYKAISALVRKERFSVFLELNALLYLGVLAFVAGAGWTIRTYFANLGDVAIISSLTLLVGVSFYYCFSRVKPWSKLQVESPNLAFDYILYLGCLLLGIEPSAKIDHRGIRRLHWQQPHWRSGEGCGIADLRSSLTESFMGTSSSALKSCARTETLRPHCPTSLFPARSWFWE